MKTSSVKVSDCTFIIVTLSLLSSCGLSSSADTINTTHTIRNGDTLVSARFELGFFSPGNSTNLYLGIWYRYVSVRTPIWVANRVSPLRNTTSGVLKLTNSGQLILQDGNNNTIWSSTATRIARSPVAQLLDSGNLVIHEAKDDRPENYLWQSFDYLSDTFVQGTDFGWNLITGMERYLSSWTSSDDPAPGNFTFHLDITGYPQLIVKRGNIVRHRLGPWNGLQFSGTPIPRLTRNYMYTDGLYKNNSLVYYREDAVDRSVISMISLSQSGVAQRWTWVDRNQEWVGDYNFPIDMCDEYGLCGAYGSCNLASSPACGCLDRFVPGDDKNWIRSDWTGGCVRRTSLNCEGDVFLGYSGIKMPDSRFTWYNESMSLEECKNMCLRNCSCTAYSNLDVRNGGSGCLIWFRDLVDIRSLPGEEQQIYIRMAASELENNAHSSGKKATKRVAILSSILAGVVVFGLSIMLFLWKRYMNKQKLRNQGSNEELELPIFDFLMIKKATNDFSASNKIGEGGFGVVYKGIMVDGKEIAVKRLSKTSTQGLDEFKNEVICIAKLQHRNLVKLLGCCIEENEKMLIYEYMPNKSLDMALFDQTKLKQLDWPKRFHIINGIARGLLYLHQDSRLRIIHRDLKTSNILLDANMNPKISDFGIARSFGGNETEANTNRIVGTYGYMSPEYAGNGIFSIKSDVYSFGVLVIELISGHKIRGFHHHGHHHNLLGHAWILHKEGRSVELADANLVKSSYMSQLSRSIHVALLCVQQSPEDRPSMPCVVLMLSSESILPQPKQPGFFMERDVLGPNTTATCSSNEYTITRLNGR